MSLLLDDDDIFVPLTKAPKPDVQVQDCNELVRREEKGQRCATGVATSLAAVAVRTETTPLRDTADADTITFARKGGNGMAKMQALMFGMPKVAVVNSSEGSSSICSTPTTAKHVRLSTVTSESAVSPVASVKSTPTTQKTRPPLSLLNSEVQSNVSSSTQPKFVSDARSPASLSLSQRQISAISLDDSLLASQDAAVEQNISLASPSQFVAASPSASPPARPLTKPSTPSSADATPTQPAKTQMKLSDFFSKMACKR